MGIYYGKKIDIANFFWKPRLVAEYAVLFFKSFGKKKDEKRKYLKMTEFESDQGYPRPSFVRDSFMSLDGQWELSDHEGEDQPDSFEDTIEVPFPPQAARSRVTTQVGDAFWYQKKFSVPGDFITERVLLHFEAVDQVAVVYLNGERIGDHEGGYLPFYFDITDHLKDGENVLRVYVRDELDTTYPYGKQSKKPGGMWYSQISGIWRSVWLESVPAERAESIRCTYLEKEGGVRIFIEGTADEYELCIRRPAMGVAAEEAGDLDILCRALAKRGSNFISLDEIKLWTPDEPWLYYVDITTGNDSVRSYFALRTIGIEEVGGMKRICLNHRPFFFHAVLDQGYYSDGLMTPVSYRYYEKDIKIMKSLGFNALRKHVKVEAARFYYDCDRLGMAVMQDMVNNGSYEYMRDTIMPTVFPFYIGHFKKDVGFAVEKETARFFITHCADTLKYLYNFPSVLYYTIFNEGWGQFDSDSVLGIIKKVDPTRVYDSTSGWYKQKLSDVESIHCYFHKVPISRWKKPAVVSEFGGYSYCVEKHSSFREKIYGYGSCHSRKSLTRRIVKMYKEEIIPHISAGICASVYTQLSDVEEEINGLYTYNRAVCKVEKDKMLEVAEGIRREIEAIQ